MSTTLKTAALCLACGHYAPADIHQAVEARDSMYDRRPMRDTVEIDACARCGSDDVETVPACVSCHTRPVQVDGTDNCDLCYAACEAKQDALVLRSQALAA